MIDTHAHLFYLKKQLKDVELGMRVREWYQKYNGEDEDNLEWDDLTEDGEWEQFLAEEGYE